tara:strand:+ start:865 stop:1464 length:600 start_codon:yes stop_codon:yes gene_type:complete
MEKFHHITAFAVPMSQANIDTDIIIPGQFLKTVKRTGLGKVLFYRLRFNEDGSENSEFLLNNSPYRNAQIIIAGDNFGCGSSREHAPWAILDYGIRCIISTSFADIFFNNAAKNGILCIILSAEDTACLMQDAKDEKEISVNLESQTIRRSNESEIKFEIEPHRKFNLLNGLDDIGITLNEENKISKFEETNIKSKPWI